MVSSGVAKLGMLEKTGEGGDGGVQAWLHRLAVSVYPGLIYCDKPYLFYLVCLVVSKPISLQTVQLAES